MKEVGEFCIHKKTILFLKNQGICLILFVNKDFIMVDEIIKSLTVIDENIDHGKMEAVVRLSVPEYSIVFKGHFPNRPILAGAYQLLIGGHWIKKLFKEDVITEKISEAKFRTLIGPDEEFLLNVKVTADSTENQRHKAQLKITKDDKIAMSATLFINTSSL